MSRWHTSLWSFRSDIWSMAWKFLSYAIIVDWKEEQRDERWSVLVLEHNEATFGRVWFVKEHTSPNFTSFYAKNRHCNKYRDHNHQEGKQSISLDSRIISVTENITNYSLLLFTLFWAFFFSSLHIGFSLSSHPRRSTHSWVHVQSKWNLPSGYGIEF